MDFSRLPDPVFLKIFEYLPLEDCVRSGRVNKMFRRIAQLATSGTKSLDLNEDCFRNLNADQLAVILDLCAPNLERIKFPSRHALWRSTLMTADYKQFGAELDDHAQELAPIFPNYQCPRLTDIDLGYVSIDFADFDRLVRNNLKMESLVWRANFVRFPNVTCDNLKKLNILIENDASLQSLIGRCPNLQEIDLNTRKDDTDDMTANVLDEFFASVPQLRRVSLRLQNGDWAEGNFIKLESALVNFWNLSLTSLRMDFLYTDYPDDNLLYKVARSFPHLQEFQFRAVLEPTDTGIACLGDLQELEVIEFYFVCYGRRHYDQGIRQLAGCKKLRKFCIGLSYISGGSLVHLLRSCPQLEQINIWGIDDVNSSEEAAAILESLAGIPNRDIIINKCSFGGSIGSPWSGKPVKAAIRMLEESGLKIKIGWPWEENLQQDNGTEGCEEMEVRYEMEDWFSSDSDDSMDEDSMDDD